MSDKTIVAKVTNAMGHALGKLAWMTVETVFYLAILGLNVRCTTVRL